MKAIIKFLMGTGKYLYALVFIAFGALHLLDLQGFTDAMNPPGGMWTVLISGILLVGIGISIIIGKLDKLSTFVLGLVYLVFAFMLNFGGVLEGSELSLSMFLKDLGLAGGAWMYASGLAKDDSVIG